MTPGRPAETGPHRRGAPSSGTHRCRWGSGRARDSVKLGVGVGLLLAAVGAGVGVLLIAATGTDCAGVDGPCPAHPQGLEGTAVVVISLMLAILIWLTGRVAKAAIDGGATR